MIKFRHENNGLQLVRPRLVGLVGTGRAGVEAKDGLVAAVVPWHKGAMGKKGAESTTRSRISIDLPLSVRRRLRVVAARRDMTLQTYVRRAVERQLAEDVPDALRSEDDPVLAELWSNEADAVYDEL